MFFSHLIFFFKQKTAYEIPKRDWSSDVCSSDLSLDFAEADTLSSMDKVFIAELMPKNTIYTNLLPKDAQEAIGKTHEATTPARKLLEAEGMRYTGYIDIFDGGPTLVSRTNDLRAVQDSRYVKAHVVDEKTERQPEGELYLVSTTDFANFRCCMTAVDVFGNHVVGLPQAVADALQITEGTTVRIVPMASGRRF